MISNKDVLLAKIDTLWQSVSDTQLATVILLMREIVSLTEVDEKGEMGFGQNTKRIK